MNAMVQAQGGTWILAQPIEEACSCTVQHTGWINKYLIRVLIRALHTLHESISRWSTHWSAHWTNRVNQQVPCFNNRKHNTEPMYRLLNNHVDAQYSTQSESIGKWSTHCSAYWTNSVDQHVSLLQQQRKLNTEPMYHLLNYHVDAQYITRSESISKWSTHWSAHWSAHWNRANNWGNDGPTGTKSQSSVSNHEIHTLSYVSVCCFAFRHDPRRRESEDRFHLR